ncbi:uncharacterized protein PFLUO_LOCUS6534, partial [Penicillium psychrofluorescens]|uniref:uncharacterized protein n=1 Tax=Penicillium psychrofluorescens TaxID=3158075 RepID=UPI003CCCEDC0
MDPHDWPFVASDRVYDLDDQGCVHGPVGGHDRQSSSDQLENDPQRQFTVEAIPT